MSSSIVRDGVRFTDKDFEESKSFFDFGDDGKLKGFKVYAKAKYFQKKRVVVKKIDEVVKDGFV